jgi:HEAT repeats
MQPATEHPERTVTERRRLVALAGHYGDLPTARRGLGDGSQEVRGTALGALDRLGDLADHDLRDALADPAASVRRRACELAARRPGVDLGTALADADASVVEMAAWAAGEQGKVGYVPVLMSLTSRVHGHSDPLCREAAVAALGAIGEPAALAAVVGALEDKPAVRRRAALSLVAFDGPDAEAALRRCLDDRDWQVRQIAEDLLAPDSPE